MGNDDASTRACMDISVRNGWRKNEQKKKSQTLWKMGNVSATRAWTLETIDVKRKRKGLLHNGKVYPRTGMDISVRNNWRYTENKMLVPVLASDPSERYSTTSIVNLDIVAPIKHTSEQ